MLPDFSIENNFLDIIAGIDEAGRGCLAGPVVASCVVLDRINYPKKLNDSKKLSKKIRKDIFLELQDKSKIGIGIVDNKIIDQINILNATKLAMKLAFNDLCKKYPIKINMVIVDGNFIPEIDVDAKCFIKGDQKSLSIAAASVVAKETRDEIMIKLGKKFLDYEWFQNKAYPTKFHVDKIKEIGICKHHRKSFAPIKFMI